MSSVILPGRSTSLNEIDAEQIIRMRTGDVLMKQTLLKADHFPGCQNTKLVPLIDGAPNFRQVEGLPVFGVAIPTVTGLRNVLNHLGAQNGGKKVYWHNMREEPVIYVNGQPYVVREADQPFCNLEYTGIDRTRVEDMESRLKSDILAEAQLFGKQVLVANENDEMQVVEAWEPVTEADVQTPLEVYEELMADGYDIDYLRVPVTDESAPKDSDFHLLVQRLWHIPSDAAIIFNCQMGRGRTTTGMIIASLVILRRDGAFPRAAAGPRYSAGSLPAWFPATFHSLPSAPHAVDSLLSPAARDPLLQGWFGVIRSLLRVLEQGVEAKGVLDAVVDACSSMQNLREAIASYRGRIMGEGTERKRNMLLGVCLKYLERYYMLVVFSAYLCSTEAPLSAAFTDWTASRPELRSIISRMLLRNAMTALELHRRISCGKLPASIADSAADGDDGAALMLERRAGLVLGPNTILKQDHFPGMRSSKVPQLIPGAPNFRRLEGMPVYGVAISTVEGIRGVLHAIQQDREQEIESSRSQIVTAENGDQEAPQVVWFNMREEPEVYLNGQPYVLREAGRPLKNLMEYAGIDAPRLQLMEDRLRADIWAEAAQCEGRVLVTREAAVEGQHGVLQDVWEPLSGPQSVQTPAMVYQQLQAAGLRVHYFRVPVTDGTAPSAADFDVIREQILRAGLNTPVVFNCQMGIGRTTTGMTIAGLLHLGARLGSTPRILTSANSTDNLLAAASGIGQSPLPPTWSFPLTDAMHASSSPAPLSLAPLHHSFSTAHVTSTPTSRTPGPPSASPILVPPSKSSAGAPPVSPRISINHSSSIPQGGAVMLTGAGRAASNALELLGTSPSVDMYDEAGHRREGRGQAPCSISPEDSAEVTEEEALEQQAMAAGAYVGVRRVARLLEGGDSAKKLVDVLLDCNSHLINLRAAIMRYCKPLHSYKYIGTEMNQRHANFSRGAAYLERYCLLIAFASFLDAHPSSGPSPLSTTFSAWIEARPDLQQALSSLHSNPGAALAPVPIATIPTIYQVSEGEGNEVDLEEQQLVLNKRRGRTLTKRTILKSYPLPPELPSAAPFSGLRQASGLPVYTVGNIPVDDVRRLLQHLGAGPGGSCRVVVSDVREELVTYVNGMPYIRRELEMPSAALHHAGIKAKQLERLEALLVSELRAEVRKWGGQLLLHREIPRRASISSGPPGAESPPGSHRLEDITSVVDAQPGAAVVAFWESVYPPQPSPALSPCASPNPIAPPAAPFPEGLYTPREVIEQLQQEGYNLSYRRIPLSRERTPEAADVDSLHEQLRDGCPVGAAAAAGAGQAEAAAEQLRGVRLNGGSSSIGRTTAPASSTGDGAGSCGRTAEAEAGEGWAAVHLVLSRTASGSSARFAAAALVAGLLQQQYGGTAGEGQAAGWEMRRTLSKGRVSSAADGEYRGIVSLCRVLPGGTECKAAVDTAIDCCAAIGNIRLDILDCAQRSTQGGAAAATGSGSAAFAARQLGIHYLRRYFLLIAFRCYLQERRVSGSGGGGEGEGEGAGAFSAWMGARAELGHLMHHLSLET